MSLDLTPEQKATGKANFEQATGDLARAGKMNTMVAGGAPDLEEARPPRRAQGRNRRRGGRAGVGRRLLRLPVVEGEQGRPHRAHRLRR